MKINRQSILGAVFLCLVMVCIAASTNTSNFININATGDVTAATFHGNGAGITGLPSGGATNGIQQLNGFGTNTTLVNGTANTPTTPTGIANKAYVDANSGSVGTNGFFYNVKSTNNVQSDNYTDRSGFGDEDVTLIGNSFTFQRDGIGTAVNTFSDTFEANNFISPTGSDLNITAGTGGSMNFTVSGMSFNFLNGSPINGNGLNITNLQGSNIVGVLPAVLVTAGSTNFSGSLVVAKDDGSGNTNLYTTVNGSALTGLNGSSVAIGTVADARLSGNVALANANNTFSGVQVLSNFGNTISGNGTGLTNLNASKLASGSIADALLSANVAFLNATNQAYAGTNTFTTNVIILGKESIGGGAKSPSIFLTQQLYSPNGNVEQGQIGWNYFINSGTLTRQNTSFTGVRFVGNPANANNFSSFFVSMANISGTDVTAFNCAMNSAGTQIDTAFSGAISAISSSVQTNTAAFTFNGSIPTLGSPFTAAAQRGWLDLSMVFVDSSLGTPSASVVIAYATKTNTFTLSPLVGTLVGTVTNSYFYRLGPSSKVTITDTSTGSGASVSINAATSVGQE